MSLRAPSGPDAEAFERCMSVGGVAVFPSDTVYGLACDVHSRVAVERLYRLKRRLLDKPSAVMFFSLELALAAVPEIGERTGEALGRLMPGAVSVLLPNPGLRFPLACGADRLTLGLRVPDLPALAGVRWPVLQSSANLAGGPEARELAEVPIPIRGAAEMVIDGGRLPGTASTLIDLRRYEAEGTWRIVRRGAVGEDAVTATLAGQFHFDPGSYATMIRDDIPVYDALQDEAASASASPGAAAGAGAGADPGAAAPAAAVGRRLRDRHGDLLERQPTPAPTSSGWTRARRCSPPPAPGCRRIGPSCASDAWRTRCPRVRFSSWPAHSASTTSTAPASATCSCASARRSPRAAGSCSPTSSCPRTRSTPSPR